MVDPAPLPTSTWPSHEGVPFLQDLDEPERPRVLLGRSHRQAYVLLLDTGTEHACKTLDVERAGSIAVALTIAVAQSCAVGDPAMASILPVVEETPGGIELGDHNHIHRYGEQLAIDLQRPARWLAFTRHSAVEFARALLQNAVNCDLVSLAVSKPKEEPPC